MTKLDTPPAPWRESSARQDVAQKVDIRSTNHNILRTPHSVLRFVLALFLCLTILAVFIPLNASMPVPSLDVSWMMALNQAVAQHLTLGKDVIFTYGPYASIYTRIYHPATDRLMIWSSALLALSYFALLLLLGAGQKSYGIALYALFLVCLLNSRDALLFSYPLIVALIAYRMTLPDGHKMKLRLTKSLEICFTLLLTPLGLLPLVKVSISPLCGVTAVLCCVLFWRAGQKTFLASAVIVVPAASCVLLWVASGQPAAALPRFFLSTQQIISGYTEAMAAEGDPFEWIMYLLASATLLLVVVWAARGGSSRWFLVACYGMFLFTAFKTGFIRQDEFHDVTAGSAILAAALLLMVVLGAKRSWFPLVMAALVWAYTNHPSVKAVADDVALNSRTTFQGALLGARMTLKGRGQLEREYNERIAAIQKEFPLDRLPGTTDIYSYNQSWLLASENTWEPRPVIQSYSAYTPELAELNLRHLGGKSAPDNVLFRVEPINGTLPSLEDGASWPALINGYVPWKFDGQVLYLRKRVARLNSIPPAHPDLYESKHEFGEEVFLPESDEPLFARIEISATPLGRILSALFKPRQLHITLRLRDGRVMTYRAISDVMRSDFLISPLVDSTEEFALLAKGRNKYLAPNEVKSITMSSDDRRGWFWNPSYALRLHKVDLQKNTEAENRLLFDDMNGAKPASLSTPAMLNCEGSIESVNGDPPSSGITTVESVLIVNGWMGISAKDGIVPDSVIVSLTSENGKALYVRAHSTQRNDVRRHFHQPGMPDPGYGAMIDVSGLKGRYTLGLSRMYKGNRGICQQFKIPLLINP